MKILVMLPVKFLLLWLPCWYNPFAIFLQYFEYFDHFCFFLIYVSWVLAEGGGGGGRDKRQFNLIHFMLLKNLLRISLLILSGCERTNLLPFLLKSSANVRFSDDFRGNTIILEEKLWGDAQKSYSSHDMKTTWFDIDTCCSLFPLVFVSFQLGIIFPHY